jgi:hypothetical protein
MLKITKKNKKLGKRYGGGVGWGATGHFRKVFSESKRLGVSVQARRNLQEFFFSKPFENFHGYSSRKDEEIEKLQKMSKSKLCFVLYIHFYFLSS